MSPGAPIEKAGPIYVRSQVKENIKGRILQGEFPPGARVPSERDLATRLKVSRPSIRDALQELVNEGYLYRVPFKGTFTTKREVSKKMIGLLVSPLLKMSFFSRIVSGVEAAVSRHGGNLILRCANENPYVEQKHLHELADDGVAGMIVSPGMSSLVNRALYEQVSQRVPLVVVDVWLGRMRADHVSSDDERGAYEVTTHLIELGHRSILHLAGCLQHSTAALRLKGYREALRENQLEFHDELVRQTDWSLETGYYETKKFLLKRRNRISAVFACADDVAVGAYRAIRELGLQVPRDISLVGYGNLDVASLLEAPLTTVDQDPEKMGAEAFALLLERVAREQHDREPKQVVVPTRLVIRESCGVKMPPKGRPTHRSQSLPAFTLVELLVVMTIIAVLAALLAPALSRTRETAKSVACMNNMKQMGQGVFIYLNDNDGFLPGEISFDPPAYWWSYAIGQSIFGSQNVNAQNLNKLFSCPSTKKDGFESCPWVTSYGPTLTCNDETAGITGGWTSYWAGSGRVTPKRFDRITPNSIILIEKNLDGLWGGVGWPYNYNQYGYANPSSPFFPLWGPSYRHAKMANFLFTDGRVESCPIGAQFSSDWERR